MRRLTLLALVALGLAPGTWMRATLPPPDPRPILHIEKLPAPERVIGPLRFLGAWRLTSPNEHFGSYSALVALGGGRLLAGSDRGRMLEFSAPGAPPQPARFDYFAGHRPGDRRRVDLEALARDRASGRLWAAYEYSNLVERIDPRTGHSATVRPPAMRNWWQNRGAEAMTRLADGRFVILAERSPRVFSRSSPGLLFAGDPIEHGDPVRFSFAAAAGYSPTDMAQLPDGQVLIVLRAVTPRGFAIKLALADPAAIAAGQIWRAQQVFDLVGVPRDNFEGLAIEPRAAGGASVWLISDSNRAVLLQRTLLLEFAWVPPQKARGSTARPAVPG